ncbi:MULTISPECIES: flagellar protein FlaG [Pseudomonas]|uniref:flagellar protein FlaG n=1 Tax=Pseudomonas aeruginosa group TaxID=136841 RepID=UPI000852A2DB|nr:MULTISPECIES: flagellar protein FlaG [Pseudomonas]
MVMQVTPIAFPIGAAASKDRATAGEANGARGNDSTSAPTADRGQLSEAVRSLQESVQSVRRNLAFSIDESTGEVVVKVMAADSGEVIRQIPSEEALRLAQSLKESEGGASILQIRV